jgi:cell division protein ZapA
MAEEKKKRQIRLHLYDTEMAVNVNRDEEEELLYRKAAKLITDTVNTYSNLLKGRKSEKDILYAAMLDIALRFEKTDRRNDTTPFEDILGKLTQEIEDALK